jgi:hypothetical protein
MTTGRLTQPRAEHWEDPDTEPPIRFVEPQTLNEVGQGYY